MARLILKLKIASVGNRDFPAPNLPPPNDPNNNIGSVNVFIDDVTEINGDISLRGEHSGFCFMFACQTSGSARRYIRCWVYGKGDSATAVKFRREDASTSTSKCIP